MPAIGQELRPAVAHWPQGSRFSSVPPSARAPGQRPGGPERDRALVVPRARLGLGALVTVHLKPAARSIRLQRPIGKEPDDRLSGDQNGKCHRQFPSKNRSHLNRDAGAKELDSFVRRLPGRPGCVVWNNAKARTVDQRRSADASSALRWEARRSSETAAITRGYNGHERSNGPSCRIRQGACEGR